ncbi:MAG: GNAT family N-acetyltransferase [Bacteroidetes bacterium]|nr:GNAT family N-acetyltransferase [Bacteroidota bacterium]
MIGVLSCCMIYAVETDRLVLREILASDADALFQLDSDPEVMRHMHSAPMLNLAAAETEIIAMQHQRQRDGIARWAVIERDSGEFLGISGLRIVHEHRNGHEYYHSLGYRFLWQHWGKGYATEAATASLRHWFETLHLDAIYATTTLGNAASRRVLEKSGMRFVNEFDYHGHLETWYAITREEWLSYHSRSV